MTKSSLQQIIQALNDAHVRYMVVGGIAVTAHGYVRLILDVDLLLPSEDCIMTSALSALRTLGYSPTKPATENPQSIQLKSGNHHETMIDIFVATSMDFDAALSRAQQFGLPENLPIPICGYVDLIAAKTKRATSLDLLDLHQLAMAHSALRLPEEDPWTQCTFEGSQRASLRRTAALSFADKLDWIEDAPHLTQGFRADRRKMDLKTLAIDGQLED